MPANVVLGRAVKERSLYEASVQHVGHVITQLTSTSSVRCSHACACCVCLAAGATCATRWLCNEH
jgi:hypothetical protein